MRNYLLSALTLLLCWLSPKMAFTQCDTAEFNVTPSAECASTEGCTSFEQTIGGVVFVFTLNTVDEGGSMQFLPSGGGVGGSGSMDIHSGDEPTHAVTETVSIVRKDGQQFKFNSIYIQNELAEQTTVQGYKAGSTKGAAQTVAKDDTATLDFGGLVVDQVKITSVDFYFISFDNFSICANVEEEKTFYKDNDEDGFGNNNITVVAVTAPEGYVDKGNDCNDNNNTIYPGATEVCDNADNDCDGSIDEGVTLTTFYQDSDDDGYGKTNVTIQACTAPAGYAASGGDCNDANDAIHPGATEVCDNADNDCDGSIDEGVTLTTFYQDSDNDGFGKNNVTLQACTAPAGFVDKGNDCNDANSAIYPGATEVCDNVDNDCDGVIDDGALTTFYQDSDKDGYGKSNVTVQACSAPAGYVAAGGDCNDLKYTIYPGAPELCDKIDNDCDGLIDDGLVLTTYYNDYDRDGFGNVNSAVQACTAPAGYITQGGDCNDKKSTINPNAPELCDNIDNNCNGVIDEGFTPKTFYRDYDKDSYGNPLTTIQACIAPTGYVANNLDCNDKNSAIRPGATEVANGVDDDCDGSVDEAPKAVTSAPDAAVEEAITSARIKVSAVPNPSSSYFTLSIRSENDQPVQVRVLNILGALVEQKLNVAPNSTLQIGQSYRTGTYFVEVRQGTGRHIMKLLKGSE